MILLGVIGIGLAVLFASIAKSLTITVPKLLTIAMGIVILYTSILLLGWGVLEVTNLTEDWINPIPTVVAIIMGIAYGLFVMEWSGVEWTRKREEK